MWTDPWGYRSNLLGDIEKEFANAEEMLNRMFRTVKEVKPQDVTSFPYYYGYQVTVGPDGKPQVREFGNIRASPKGLVEQSGVRQPLVDTAINKKDNTLTITAEMPGISKQDIKLNISDQYVSIHAEKDDKKYHTDIPLSSELDNASAKAIYTNGILELKIKLKEPPKSKSREVRVE
jgi:HSP20 family protein